MAIKTVWFGQQVYIGENATKATPEKFDFARMGSRLLMRHKKSGVVFEPIGVPMTIEYDDQPEVEEANDGGSVPAGASAGGSKGSRPSGSKRPQQSPPVSG